MVQASKGRGHRVLEASLVLGAPRMVGGTDSRVDMPVLGPVLVGMCSPKLDGDTSPDRSDQQPGLSLSGAAVKTLYRLFDSVGLTFPMSQCWFIYVTTILPIHCWLLLMTFHDWC